MTDKTNKLDTSFYLGDSFSEHVFLHIQHYFSGLKAREWAGNGTKAQDQKAK